MLSGAWLLSFLLAALDPGRLNKNFKRLHPREVSYINRLDQLNLLPLDFRRQMHDLVLLFISIRLELSLVILDVSFTLLLGIIEPVIFIKQIGRAHV